MSMGQRYFWGWLGGSNGQWCGRAVTLHFLWVYGHLKLLCWDETENAEIYLVSFENTGKYLVSFKSLVIVDEQ